MPARLGGREWELTVVSWELTVVSWEVVVVSWGLAG